MPELPDVAIYKQYFDATSLHERITGVEIRAPRLLQSVSVRRLTEALTGHAFESTRRHGKYLFAALSGDGWLMLHFGMSGDLKYFKDPSDEPPYARFVLTFANGYHLAYDSPRKLGRIGLADSVERFVRDKGLGPDALADDLDFAAFRRLLEGRHGMAKSTLLNQRILAGIGNIYGDEILFQAGIDPRTKVSDLDEGRLRDLYYWTREVLRTAIEGHARSNHLPDGYLIPHRDGDGKCPKCGGDLERTTISSRTTYYCPRDQRG